MCLTLQVQGVGAAKYNGVVASLIKIYREEGIMGYFKGNGTNCIRIIPYSAVQFGRRWREICRAIMQVTLIDTLCSSTRFT